MYAQQQRVHVNDAQIRARVRSSAIILERHMTGELNNVCKCMRRLLKRSFQEADDNGNARLYAAFLGTVVGSIIYNCFLGFIAFA